MKHDERIDADCNETAADVSCQQLLYGGQA